ncbi:unnamed protein product [Adineta ricciae]|uniref:Uncharacterized protein n=1 Tax=Adineta ricciae TaxID=249248 RepID=A0A815A2D6_ADIRI|nr:unnamed protein product [Adineta ricciae]
MVVAFLLFLKNETSASSFNQPKFCPTVKWNRYATTFVMSNVSEVTADTIFIDTHNMIHVKFTDLEKSRILVWHGNSTYPVTIHVEDVSIVAPILISDVGEIYVDRLDGQIIKHIPKGLLDDTMDMMIVAGTDKEESAFDQLNRPTGIFVDTNLDLYYNHARMSVFGYLFISDHCDGRIVASGPNGFRCSVGCDEEGSQSHQLKGPMTFSFDVDGNLYVADGDNGRIQKFDLQKDSCNQFDPHNPTFNIIAWNGKHHNQSQYQFTLEVLVNITYIWVVTTYEPNVTGSFSITALGSRTVRLVLIVDNSTYCRVGGPCSVRVKSIGLTLDDILRLEVNRNMAMHDQSFLIKISGALTVLMFIAGVLNSACSVLTFQNPKSRTVGCGLYLLASSLTSILTIIMFTIKFCFDKEKSKRWARWIIFILPIVIMSSIIHELLHRQVFTHEIKGEQSVGKNASISGKIVAKQYFLCVTSYSQSVQDYNTTILFIHLLGPFIVNLPSALFIIIGGVRRRAEAQKKQTLPPTYSRTME